MLDELLAGTLLGSARAITPNDEVFKTRSSELACNMVGVKPRLT